jgi:carboxymethylenebutenolidase
VVATTITTSASGLDTRWSTVAAHDGTQLPVYLARPTGPGPFPVVIVVQEIFGVHAHIADVARRLARIGYLAVAPELFYRQGDPVSAPDLETLRRDFVGPTADAQVIQDLDRTMAWTSTQGGDPGRVGLTGFCWGGRIAWLYAAHQPQLKAVVAWYGRLSGDRTANQPQHPIDVAGRIQVPVLGLYGGQDQGIPLTAVDAQRAAVSLASSSSLASASEIVVYPEAPNAFHADYRASYRPDAAADGWQRLLAWFSQHGVR